MTITAFSILMETASKIHRIIGVKSFKSNEIINFIIAIVASYGRNYFTLYFHRQDGDEKQMNKFMKIRFRLILAHSLYLFD